MDWLQFKMLSFFQQERAQELLVGFVDHLDTPELEENGHGSYENTGEVQLPLHMNGMKTRSKNLSCSLPKSGPFIFGSENRFL